MNLGTPPTDSLYKFLAVFGLLLIVACFAWISSSLAEVTKLVNASAEEAAILKVDSELVDLDRKQLNTHTERQLQQLERAATTADLRDKSARIALATETVKQRDALKEAHQELGRRERELIRRAALGEAKAKAIVVAATETKGYLVLQFCGISLGMLLTGVGFALWYVKLQRYQDLATKVLSENQTRKTASIGLPPDA